MNVKKNKGEERPVIGGQAVVEGVMMKGPDTIAISVRRPNGSIARQSRTYVPLSKRHKWMGWPFIRGIVNMASMLGIGLTILDTASKMLLDGQTEEPSKFEKWLSEKLGKNVDKVVMGVAAVIAIALSVLLFMVIPSLIANLVQNATGSTILINLASGITRIIILICYIWITAYIPDMKRVYMYHGAEHKSVFCHEARLPLTVENARKFSTLHPRCGTSFLLLVMIIAVLLGAVSDELLKLIFGLTKITLPLRLLRTLITLPIVAGLSYEALQSLAKSNHIVVRALRWPGLMMQHLTTKEPDDSMLEVALDALTRVVPKPPNNADNMSIPVEAAAIAEETQA